jgi:hypothetical protein
MSLAILLAFSRAAWGGLVVTSAFMLALMVLTSPSQAQRSRIIVMALVAAILAAALVAVLLSFDSVAQMFKQRASFDQSYDEGRFGRFGRHILGAEMALDVPFGIGPLQFHNYFPRGHPQFLSERVHVGRLDLWCLLSGAGLGHRAHRVPLHLRASALAAHLSRSTRHSPGGAKVLPTPPLARKNSLAAVGQMAAWSLGPAADARHTSRGPRLLGRSLEEMDRMTPIMGRREPTVLFFHLKRQSAVIGEAPDQALSHRRARRPDAGWNVRGVAQQADRAFGNHPRRRAIAGIAVALDRSADVAAIGCNRNVQEIVEAVLALFL